MSRLIPHPLLSLAMLIMWLMLTRFSLGNVVLGGAIALIAGRGLAALEPAGPRLRRWDQIVRLFFIVGWDIIRSNAAVATLILSGERNKARKSGFLEIPLELKDRHALAILAIIITATPGTAWLEHDAENDVLLLHVFDLVDDEAWRKLIKTRYEALLMEIFE